MHHCLRTSPFLARETAVPNPFSTKKVNPAGLRSVRHRTYQSHGLLQYFRFAMNKADSDRIHELCSLIAVEQDRHRFLKLVEELNRILGAKEERLQNDKQGKDSA
jgi:hypothetical protein